MIHVLIDLVTMTGAGAAVSALIIRRQLRDMRIARAYEEEMSRRCAEVRRRLSGAMGAQADAPPPGLRREVGRP